MLKRNQFPADFVWGAATASYQIEGAAQSDGKSPSVWDTFTHTEGKIHDRSTGDVACDSYHRYVQDVACLREMNFNAYRFSTAWTRILPQGTGKVNQKGIDYYNRLIDTCLSQGIQPWLTLFHWDTPQILEDKGGWTNREMIDWFLEYVQVCARAFGDRVRHWMVFNEPMMFTLLGHLRGIHAPGHTDFAKFVAAVHHTAVCQGEGGRILRAELGANATLGNTFALNPMQPYRPDNEQDVQAAHLLDKLINGLFFETSLGLGYPKEIAPLLPFFEAVTRVGDVEKFGFDYDFHGVQNYTRIKVQHDPNSLMLQTKTMTAAELGVPPAAQTEMGWEIYPEGMYQILKQYGSYAGVKQLIITENGMALPDQVIDGRVEDARRVEFYQAYLAQVQRAMQEGINIGGYFAWTLLDNFEWAEGYRPRFGLVHVDFDTQERTIKQSGRWWQAFLGE